MTMSHLGLNRFSLSGVRSRAGTPADLECAPSVGDRFTSAVSSMRRSLDASGGKLFELARTRVRTASSCSTISGKSSQSLPTSSVASIDDDSSSEGQDNVLEAEVTTGSYYSDYFTRTSAMPRSRGGKSDAATQAREQETVQAFLFAHGFSGVNSKRIGEDVSVYTYPLHVAVERGDICMVRLLLLEGADPTHGNSFGVLPHVLATELMEYDEEGWAHMQHAFLTKPRSHR